MEDKTDRPVLWRGRSTGPENAPRKADVATRAIEQRIAFPLRARPWPRQFVKKIRLRGVAPFIGVRVVVVEVISQSVVTVKGRKELGESGTESPQVDSGGVILAHTK